MIAGPRNLLLFSPIVCPTIPDQQQRKGKKIKKRRPPGCQAKSRIAYKANPRTPLPQPSPNLSSAFIRPTRALDFRCPSYNFFFSPQGTLDKKKKKKKIQQRTRKSSPVCCSRFTRPPHVHTDRYDTTITTLINKKESNGCRHRQKLFTIPIKAKLPAEESNLPKTMNDLLLEYLGIMRSTVRGWHQEI